MAGRERHGHWRGQGGLCCWIDSTGRQASNSKTSVGRHQNDDLQSFPADTPFEVYPGGLAGVETPIAFADGTVCVPVVNFPATYTASTFSFGNPATGRGEVNAIDAATRSLL